MNFHSFTAKVLVVLTLVVTGCSSSTTIPTYKISDLFKSYCLFQPGSYWIYTNDQNPSSDRVSVGEIDESTRFDPTTNDYRYEAIEMNINSNPLNITMFELTAGNTQVEAGQMNSLMRMYMNDGSYFLVFSPQYPIGEEIPLGETIGRYTNVEVLDSLTVLDNLYTDVYHTQVIMDATATEYQYYIAKNFGLVRFSATSETQTYSYSLKSSSLAQ